MIACTELSIAGREILSVVLAWSWMRWRSCGGICRFFGVGVGVCGLEMKGSNSLGSVEARFTVWETSMCESPWYRTAISG
jgi:hypothetical protein